MRCYLSAVRHLHIVSGFGDPLVGKLRLELALKGVKRARPLTPDTRLPITPLILRRIKSVLVQAPEEYDNILLWAACCLCYFAFLRSGEITVQSHKSFDAVWHITPLDLAVDDVHNPSLLQIRLKASKTDQARKECLWWLVELGATYVLWQLLYPF